MVFRPGNSRVYALESYDTEVEERLSTCEADEPNEREVSKIVRRLDELMKDTVLDDSEVGIIVYDLKEKKTLYEYQAEKLYRPASVQKIVTAVAALEFLGKAYRLETKMGYIGQLREDSTLAGDLYVKGGMDPLWSENDMQQWSREVKNAGIKRIEGRVVGDRSLKDTLKWGLGWCWDDNMPVLTPLLCEQKDSFIVTMHRALRSEGIEIGDTTVCYNDTIADSLVTHIATQQRKLTEVMERMMKKSDNLHAEALFYHLASAYMKHPDQALEEGNPEETPRYASTEQGAKMLGKLIAKLGHNPKRYCMADGSGVSLYNYLTPRLLMDILVYAYNNREIFNPLYGSLPISGIDGTLQYRMKGTAAYRSIRAKTGTLAGVCSLAGYAKAANGKMLAFVIINQNKLNRKATRKWQDRVCEALCKD